jgi:hypothetical protein
MTVVSRGPIRRPGHWRIWVQWAIFWYPPE